METARTWRLWGEWPEQQGVVHVRITCNDEDPLVSGTIQECGEESIRIYIGDRPPTVNDSVTARLVMSVYQYLHDLRDGAHDAITEEIELRPWLDKYVGTIHSAALWLVLSFEHDRRQKFPPPSPVNEWPLTWRFSARWQESPGPDWRLARLALTWERGLKSGGLEVVAKVTCQGEIAITLPLTDDLLLTPADQNWLLRQLLHRHRAQILTQGEVAAEVSDFGRWLGYTRGPRGQSIWSMISSALKTFGSH